MASKNFGRSKHTEPFRVVTDQYWPRDADSAHNARYFDSYELARVSYLNSVTKQVLDMMLMERITFERRNEHDGKYYPMFESYQRHTVESYGLEPE